MLQIGCKAVHAMADIGNRIGEKYYNEVFTPHGSPKHELWLHLIAWKTQCCASHVLMPLASV